MAMQVGHKFQYLLLKLLVSKQKCVQWKHYMEEMYKFFKSTTVNHVGC